MPHDTRDIEATPMCTAARDEHVPGVTRTQNVLPPPPPRPPTSKMDPINGVSHHVLDTGAYTPRGGGGYSDVVWTGVRGWSLQTRTHL